MHKKCLPCPRLNSGRNSQMPKTAARALLTDFLKKRRSRLHPGSVGLPSSGLDERRRTRGLRRSEVAELAGISTGWYTLFEMGQERAMRARIIEPVAQALRLNPTERDYLYELVRAEPPPAGGFHLNPVIEDLVTSSSGSVIALFDRWLSPVIWNAVAEAILEIERDDPLHMNTLWRLFRLPQLRTLVSPWEESTRFTLGLFRRALARDPLNAEAQRIQAALSGAPDFDRLWSEHHVDSLAAEANRAREAMHYQLQHSRFGVISVYSIGIDLPGSYGAHIRIISPGGPADGEALRAAGASLIAKNGGHTVYRARPLPADVLDPSF